MDGYVFLIAPVSVLEVLGLGLETGLETFCQVLGLSLGLGLEPPGLGLGPSGSRNLGRDLPRPGKNVIEMNILIVISCTNFFYFYQVDLPLNVFIHSQSHFQAIATSRP